MIVNMKFLSITGPKNDIDRVADTYLSKYEIHLENAFNELSGIQGLSPYVQVNPYHELFLKAKEYVSILPTVKEVKNPNMSLEQAGDLIRNLDESFQAFDEQKRNCLQRQEQITKEMELIYPFRTLDYDLTEIRELKYIHARFGKMPKSYYMKFISYVYHDLCAIFHESSETDDMIWGVYFVPDSEANRIDAIFSSMHFERIHISKELNDSPKNYYEKLSKELRDKQIEYEECEQSISSLLEQSTEPLCQALHTFDDYNQSFDIRKMAACTNRKEGTFYILCGWMSDQDVEQFQNDIKGDNNIYCVVSQKEVGDTLDPPIRLKNPKIFKPFEMYVSMYGLPNYKELDPTIFIALTYSFIFGVMFGDAGQGLCLLIGGYLLYKYKKMALGGIISMAGVFSTLFGILFGSFFGFEDVIPALWMHPRTDMSNLPMIGTINAIMVYAVVFGMFMILSIMVLHIINACRLKNTEGKYFDTNSIIGFVFYSAIIAIVFLLMTGHALPAGILLVLFFLIPLLIIMFREPLARIIDKHKPYIEESLPIFIVQNIFELIEVLISYFSNTLSFVRVGAFAVSHAAMMEVVLMLAGTASGASPNWLIIVLGNLFVMVMEGMIVGIQVLRLEYYELFSRFYLGNGKPFKPFLKKEVTD